MVKRYKRKNPSYGEIFFWLAVFSLVIIAKKNLGINSLNLKALPVQSVYKVAGAFLAIILLRVFVGRLLRWKKRRKYLKSGITTVDQMKGNEFEKFLVAHFSKLGYSGRLTKESSDYGADILLKKGEDTIVVQAKRYSSKVGIKAIQEIVGSLQYYKANKGIVATNSYFTSNAAKLAAANNIELWDRNKLIDIMTQNGSQEFAKNTLKETLDSKVCPECGNKLVLKDGKHGKFYGCQNYPKCQFTRNN